MGKLFGYHTLGVLLKSLSDSCFRADEQEKRGEKVTACGMSSDEIEDLCENYLPYALNPMLSTEEVKEKLHVSDATLNRMVARGDIPNGECKKRGHTRYWKKWDILHFFQYRVCPQPCTRFVERQGWRVRHQRVFSEVTSKIYGYEKGIRRHYS